VIESRLAGQFFEKIRGNVDFLSGIGILCLDENVDRPAKKFGYLRFFCNKKSPNTGLYLFTRYLGMHLLWGFSARTAV
jgi:hypothetical protein